MVRFAYLYDAPIQKTLIGPTKKRQSVYQHIFVKTIKKHVVLKL